MARAMRLDGDALRQCISTMTTRRPSVPKPDRRIETDPTQRPGTLDECRRCPLWHDATQGVGGVGPAHAAIMMVGEQPGDSEDREGRPFVGPAGRLLDDALREAGVTRGTVFVTNAVKHFKWEPRGKRRMHKTPAQREVDACRYWLERELTRVSPRVVVALGSTALKALLQDAHVRLQDYFGKATAYEGRTILATWHPSYALRAPDAETRNRAYSDIVDTLAKAKRIVEERESGKKAD